MSHPNDISLETRIQVTALVAAQMFGGIKTPHELAATAKEIVDAVIEQYKPKCYICMTKVTPKCHKCGVPVCNMASPSSYDAHNPLVVEGYPCDDHYLVSFANREWRCVKCAEAK